MLKAIVETPVSFGTPNIAEEFLLIVNTITGSSSGKNLANSMVLYSFSHFIYGFGSSHMWVKLTNGDDRIILVEL